MSICCDDTALWVAVGTDIQEHTRAGCAVTMAIGEGLEEIVLCEGRRINGGEAIAHIAADSAA